MFAIIQYLRPPIRRPQCPSPFAALGRGHFGRRKICSPAPFTSIMKWSRNSGV